VTRIKHLETFYDKKGIYISELSILLKKLSSFFSFSEFKLISDPELPGFGMIFTDPDLA
jgi:hypothetical protein